MLLDIDESKLLKLPPLVRQHAIQLDNAIFGRDAFSSIVWAAVTLESLLEETLLALNQDSLGRRATTRPDLGGMLSDLESVLKQIPAENRLGAEMLDRAHSIRVARNITVHHTGHAKGDLTRQAEKVREDLEFILRWWFDQIYSPDNSTPKTVARVFLATITPDHPKHRAFLAELKHALVGKGLEPVTVAISEYDKHRPLAVVAETMKGCDAVLIVGLERSRAYLVCDREGTLQEREDVHRRYSSAWLHMEAGLAYGLGFGERVFVLCEQTIWSEGVFDRDWNQYRPIVMPVLDAQSPEVSETLNRIQKSVGMLTQRIVNDLEGRSEQ